ncbi:MAG: PPC domain-containing protein [Planctomycetia bacterium]|nr:PPC domain-containing protein [Planctomycetia bacterium]
MRFRSSVLFLLAISISASTADAQYQRHIEAVFPRAGQRGTTIDLEIHGLFLEDPQEVLFYRPGIRAVAIETLPDLSQLDAQGKLNPVDKRIGGRAFGATVKQRIRAKVTIDADCPIGLHPLRVRTGKDITTLSTFWVTPFPVQAEAEPFGELAPNSVIARAEVLSAPNVTVLGYILPGPIMDHDIYRVTRKKGERISVEVNSVRLSNIWWARGELDLLVKILDASGKELALSDDTAMLVQDPLVSILAPHDGDYFIEIAQSLYSDTSNSFYTHYLAHIGTFETPQAIYPAGGMAGQPLDVTLIGDPLGNRAKKISLPAETGDFEHDFGAAYPLSMRVSKYRNVLESAEKKTPPVVNEAGELPVALNGIISRPNEVDEFRLRPKKDQGYLVRVYARSLGTPLDPQIDIRPEGAEDAEVTADDVANYEERGLPGVPNAFRRLSIMDPSIVWKPKGDGPHIFRIKDIRNQGAPTCVYRVEIEPLENRVNTYLVTRNYSRESPRDSGLAIPQGNRWTLQLGLSQGQGNPYRDELQLVAEGLPPGVEMIAPPIRTEAGSYPATVPIQFVAKPDAKPQAALIRVLARPAKPGVEFHSRAGQAILYVGDHFGQSSNSLIVDQYALAVTNPAPFSVDVEVPKIPLIQDGELSVKVKLHRKPGFDEPIQIVSAWNPAGVGSEPTMEIPAGVSEAIYRFTATTNATPATWQVAIQARTLPREPKDVAGTGQLQVSSPFFNLTVAQPYVRLVSEPVGIRRGANAKFVWKVSPQHPFKAVASAKLSGLPKGIQVAEPLPVLKPNADELVFELRADNEALLGQYKEIGVELTFREEGQEIRQRTGVGVLRIDPALQK